jgi:KaiC/GvpD/RAD55 family RecA-like ATPase
MAVHDAWHAKERAQIALERAMRSALGAGFSLQLIAEHAGMSHEQVRQLTMGEPGLRALALDATSRARPLAASQAMPTGLAPLDAVLPGGGAHRGQALIAAGKSGTGKSGLASQIVVNMASQNKRCVIVALEQTREQVLLTLIKQRFDVGEGTAKLLLGDPKADLGGHEEAVRAELQRMLDHVVIIDGIYRSDTLRGPWPAMTVEAIAAMVDQAAAAAWDGAGADVVVVDHLGLVHTDPAAPLAVREDLRQAGSYLLGQLVHMAQRLQAFTIIVAQLPKSVSEGERFEMGSVFGSGLDRCDYALAVWREGASRLEMELQKNRHGERARMAALRLASGRYDIA